VAACFKFGGSTRGAAAASSGAKAAQNPPLGSNSHVGGSDEGLLEKEGIRDVDLGRM